MLGIFRQQHYNTMLTHDFPQFYLDCEETGEPELIWVASKSGSMNACRNDGGIIHTPYGEYVIVLMNRSSMTSSSTTTPRHGLWCPGVPDDPGSDPGLRGKAVSEVNERVGK